jgi:aerobic carbon-monoxide dehydrogenase large subunit
MRWVEDRSEHLLASAHSRDHHYRVTAYADRHGKVLGLEILDFAVAEDCGTMEPCTR